MFCPKCGKEIAGSPAFCPHCGTRLGPGQAANKPKLSVIAGVLDIIGGGLGLLTGLGLLIFFAIVFNVAAVEDDILYGFFYAVLVPCFLVIAVGGVMAIVGGIYALKRKNWPVALIGAIAAALGMGVLGIAALVLTVLAKDEFER